MFSVESTAIDRSFDGSLKVAEVDAVQPLASVTVTEYEPAAKPLTSPVVPALAGDHAYVYGAVPPVAVV